MLHVQKLFRHKNIRNTLIYITIEKDLYREQSTDEFHVKVAKNVGGNHKTDRSRI